MPFRYIESFVGCSKKLSSPTCRIMPVSKWLRSMANKSPK